MKKIVLSSLLLSALLTGSVYADTSTKTTTSPYNTDKEKLSYVFGYNIGMGLRTQQIEVDQKILETGLSAGLSGAAPVMQPAEMQTVMMNFQKSMEVKQAAAMKAFAAKNLSEGSAFMKANAAKPGVKSTDNGQLQYRVITTGKGPTPKLTDKVVFTYVGKLVNGTVFDASKDNGAKPVALAINQMIPGMQKILTMMPVGSTWEIVIAPSMAYGERGVPMSPIGPNATLVFTLTMKNIVNG